MKCIFFLFLLFPVLTFAQDPVQEVIGGTADQFSNNKVIVTAILGEPVSETFASNQHIVTQGFLQGDLLLSQVRKDLPFPFEISVYPNPVTDILLVETEKENLSYQVLDLTGRILMQGNLGSHPKQIRFSGFEAGTYFLVIENNRTHKIIKH